jgi:hypothetical protein
MRGANKNYFLWMPDSCRIRDVRFERGRLWRMSLSVFRHGRLVILRTSRYQQKKSKHDQKFEKSLFHKFLFHKSLFHMSLMLFRAAQRGDLELVKQEFAKIFHKGRFDLLSVRRAHRVAVRNNWADVERRLRPFPDVWSEASILRIATKSGSTQVILAYLVMHPVYYATVLNRVCKHGHKHVAKCLVPNNSIVRPQDKELDPMYSAIMGGHARVVLWLLQAKASLHSFQGFMKPTTPLALAQSMCKYSVRHRLVLRLLERALRLERALLLGERCRHTL